MHRTRTLATVSSDGQEKAPAEPGTVPVEPVTGAPASAPRNTPRDAVETAPRPVKRAKGKPPAEVYADDLTARKVPSQRQIRADLKVGQEKAKAVQTELTALLTECVPAVT